MEQIRLDFTAARQVRTVSQLTAAIRGLLSDEFGDVWVSGEISGVKPAPSGHIYFTLKDAGAQIRCACFKSSLRFIRFKPQEGAAVQVRGRVDVYEPRGEYQLLVEAIEPRGHGALQLAFERLKAKLELEGLFDPARKRPLPRFPRRIGIVTSMSGAVIRDMIHVLERRFPGIHIRLYPALVQGVGSVEAVVDGIDWFSSSGWPDLLIVGRGGGSLEDLWTFNEEAVARAIAACSVPVISAVGHETDFTIADFVADLRAPTPSAAAEMAVPLKSDLLDRIAAAAHRAERAAGYKLAVLRSRLERMGTGRAIAVVQRRIGRAAQRVDELDGRSRRSVERKLADLGKRLQSLDARLHKQDLRVRLASARARLAAADTALARAMDLRLRDARRRLERPGEALAQLSPLRVLDRGYAIVQNAEGHVVMSASDAEQGTDVRIRLARGRLAARVISTEP